MQAVVEVLMSGVSDMDTVTRVNATMKLDAESAGGAVPQPIQRRVDDVSTAWAALQSLAILLQSPSGASFSKQPGTSIANTRCNVSIVLKSLITTHPLLYCDLCQL